MNMFKPTTSTSIKDYFDRLPEERKATLLYLHNFIQKTAPALKPIFAYNMPGYGTFNKYKNYKKEVVDWPIVALASQKYYMSIYICALENGHYLAEKHKGDLGKVSVGKSCIRFKKLADLNLDMLEKIIKQAAKSPGFGGN